MEVTAVGRRPRSQHGSEPQDGCLSETPCPKAKTQCYARGFGPDSRPQNGVEGGTGKWWAKWTATGPKRWAIHFRVYAPRGGGGGTGTVQRLCWHSVPREGKGVQGGKDREDP